MDLVWPDKDERSAEHDVSKLGADQAFGDAAPKKPETAAIGKTIRARVDQEIKNVKLDVMRRHVIPLPE